MAEYYNESFKEKKFQTIFENQECECCIIKQKISKSLVYKEYRYKIQEDKEISMDKYTSEIIILKKRKYWTTQTILNSSHELSRKKSQYQNHLIDYTPSSKSSALIWTQNKLRFLINKLKMCVVNLIDLKSNKEYILLSVIH